jgi:hypothetical protein
MDNTTMLLGLMAVCMVGATINAWRIGNERRDVVLLGVIAGVCGVGTGVLATA